MDFTEIYEQSGNLVYFSPGAHFILNSLDDVLIVRRADTLLITHTWTIGHPSETATILSSSRPQLPATASFHQWISHAGWSCDSEYIFAASVKGGIVRVFKLRDEEWNARIETGAEGLTKAEWAPDGRHILCFSEWGVSLLLSKTAPLSLLCDSSASPSGHLLQEQRLIYSFQFIPTEVPAASCTSRALTHPL